MSCFAWWPLTSSAHCSPIRESQTERKLLCIRWVAERSGLDGFAICLNGAFVYNLDRDEVVRVWPLETAAISNAVERLRNNLPDICFHWEKERGLGRDPAYESYRSLESQEVIAFGDMPNDIPMLLWAGYSVVMGNAQQAVRQIADEIAPHNCEDGVAVVIERLLGKETLIATSKQ